ncbi:MAG: SocA family protein [Proteobacteria bacterium]|nr:SocA family protein [Pseudomonadota bacterium]
MTNDHIVDIEDPNSRIREKGMCVHLQFDYKKSTQALNFLARKNSGQINKMKAIKLVYFADRYHLRKYGRPITNDEYYAMVLGPVNSGVKDLAEMTCFLGPKEEKYAKAYLESVDQYTIQSVQDCDTEVFSESDQEALSFAWGRFGHYNQFELADITHRYPEWKKHETALNREDTSRVRMKYEDFFEDPPIEVEQCHSLNNQDRTDRMEELQELAKIESLWN